MGLNTFIYALPLRQKLITLIFVVSTVASLLGFSVYAVRDLRALHGTVVDNANLIARTVATYSAADLAFRDTNAARETLAGLSDVPHVINAFLFDNEGRLFASLRKTPAAPLKLGALPSESSDYIHVVTPVRFEGRDYGQLYLLISRAPLQAGMRDALITLGLLVVVVLILALALAYRLQRYVSQPILELAAAAQHVSDAADYSTRLAPPADDEIGALYRAFNTLLARTQLREAERDRAHLALRASDAQVRLLLNSTAEAIYGADVNGVCTFANPACVQMLGYASEADLIGRSIHDLIHHSHPDGAPYPIEACAVRIATLAGQTGHRDDEVHWRADGTSFPVEYWSHPMYTDGQLVGSVVTFVDISERKHAESSLQRFRAALDSSVDAIYLIDRKAMRFIDANRAAWKSVGLTREELLTLGPQDLKTEMTRAALEAAFDDILASPTGHGVIRTTHLRKDAAAFPVEVFLQRLIDPNDHSGQPILVALARDISERVRAEADLHRMAYFDSLTNLPNRLLFNDRLRQALADGKRRERFVALMLLDIDRFKMVNDTMGHEAGDQLLREMALRLRGGVREGDTVARLGGDEFALIFPDLTDTHDAAQMAQNILLRLSAPVDIEGREVFSSASIGITLYPTDTDEADSLIKFADSAMYHAKEQGRSNYQFYSRDMTARTQIRLHLETDLRHALDRGEFFLQYQPQVDIPSGRITGMEALLRWRNARGELISPAHFIPLAEETGLIVPIGEWVLEHACRQLKAWHDAGRPDLTLAVNVAARQFRDRLFAQAVRHAITVSGIAPQRLELEITEGVLLDNSEEIRRTLQDFKSTDILLAIDDFGTGYSSLSYLKRFPIDRVKIDQSFVRDLDVDNDDLAIVKAIIALARTLKLRVIAEGVETEAQLDLLRAEGCDEFQGYHFARPLDAEAFSALLQSASKRAPER